MIHLTAAVTGAWVKTALCGDADAKDWQRPETLKVGYFYIWAGVWG